jgi:hypothetical protein
MAGLGISPHVIEASLNHVSGHKAGGAGVYNRSNYAAESKAALTRWADHLQAIVNGQKSNVVSLKSAPSHDRTLFARKSNIFQEP